MIKMENKLAGKKATKTTCPESRRPKKRSTLRLCQRFLLMRRVWMSSMLYSALLQLARPLLAPL